MRDALAGTSGSCSSITPRHSGQLVYRLAGMSLRSICVQHLGHVTCSVDGGTPLSYAGWSSVLQGWGRPARRRDDTSDGPAVPARPPPSGQVVCGTVGVWDSYSSPASVAECVPGHGYLKGVRGEWQDGVRAHIPCKSSRVPLARPQVPRDGRGWCPAVRLRVR